MRFDVEPPLCSPSLFVCLCIVGGKRIRTYHKFLKTLYLSLLAYFLVVKKGRCALKPLKITRACKKLVGVFQELIPPKKKKKIINFYCSLFNLTQHIYPRQQD